MEDDAPTRLLGKFALDVSPRYHQALIARRHRVDRGIDSRRRGYRPFDRRGRLGSIHLRFHRIVSFFGGARQNPQDRARRARDRICYAE